VIGPVHGGWRVAMTTLTSERGAIGGGEGVTPWAEVLGAARAAGRTDDPLLRQELVRAYTRSELLRFLGFRMQTALSKGVAPGPESSIIKLVMSAHAAHVGDLVEAIEGADGMLATNPAALRFLSQWTVRIGGGTDQVQRNVIGERVLGLPAEPRADKDVSFRDLTRT
jgi:alkylation response protein AidB-like acyl-CoA dehydrogenase